MSDSAAVKLLFLACALLAVSQTGAQAGDPGQTSAAIVMAQASDGGAKGGDPGKDGDKEKAASQNGGDDKKEKPPEKTPEEKMQARFPQPVKVSHLVGLPVLDDNDSTIGYVQQVVRTPEGKIQLIVPYAKRFGFVRSNTLWSRRPVAVPIEVVAIVARQINAVDMDRPSFEKAPTWEAALTKPIPPDETIKIALGRR